MGAREQRIASRIRGLRQNMRPKLTQAALAEKLGVETQTVWLWENARAVPEGSNLEKLATFFKVDEPYFTSATLSDLAKPTQDEPTVPESVALKIAEKTAERAVERMRPKTVEDAVAEFDRVLRGLDFPDGRRALAMFLLSGSKRFLIEYKQWKDAHLTDNESSRLSQLLQAIQKSG